MATYSSKRPVKVLDVDSSKYVNEHLTHFFNVYSMECLLKSPQETRERAFEMVTKHEDLLVNLFGDSISKSQLLLPKLLRDGADSPLVLEYKQWLGKQ
jgi:hypothetical protein